MKQFVSEIVGEAHLADGSRRAAYRALRPLLCGDCGVEIAEGALFTRWPVPGLESDVVPRCPACAPFQAEADGGGTRSRLLSALLSPDGAEASGTPRQSSEVERVRHPPRDEGIGRAVERRLGPALARSRKRRP